MSNFYASNLRDIRVSEIMSRNVICVYENMNLKEIEKVFKDHKIMHIPVINEGMSIVGIISLSDFLLYKKWNNFYNEGLKNEIFIKKSIHDIMVKNPLTISPQDKTGKVADLLMTNNLKCLPVVDTERKVLGIVSSIELTALAYTDTYHKVLG